MAVVAVHRPPPVVIEDHKLLPADGWVICAETYDSHVTGSGCELEAGREESQGWFKQGNRLWKIVPYREYLQMRKPGVIFVGVQLQHSSHDGPRAVVYYALPKKKR